MALGFDTTASGDNGATALGSASYALGDGSFAIGGGRLDEKFDALLKAGKYDDIMAKYANAFTKEDKENLKKLSGEKKRKFAMAKVAKYRRKTGDSNGPFAFGGVALGEDSIAMGAGTIATGDYSSTAIGSNTTATGYSSIAMGSNTTATGDSSIAIGSDTTATGYSSIAIGYETKGTGDLSTAMGGFTEASGLSSTAMGGFTTATGELSTAMGYETKALGEVATAMGYGSKAIGKGSLTSGGIVKKKIYEIRNELMENVFGLDYTVKEGQYEEIRNKYGDFEELTKLFELDSRVKKDKENDRDISYEYDERRELGEQLFNKIVEIETKKVNKEGGIAYTEGSMALGTGTIAGKNNGKEEAVAIGYRAEATGDKSMALGFDAIADMAGGVALGSNARTTADKGKAGYDAGTKTATTKKDATWVATNAALAIGDASKEQTRQITGLAAGTDDTDAVNVAQLKSVATSAATSAAGMATGKLKNYFHVNATDKVQIGNETNLAVVDGIGGAKGIASMASGINAQALTTNSIAIGKNAVAGGPDKDKEIENYQTSDKKIVKEEQDSAIAIGHGAQATGEGAIAIGSKSITKNYINNEGKLKETISEVPIASGKYSTAMGSQTQASGWTSTAIGYGTTALGNMATATGEVTSAIGRASIATGLYTKAEGKNSIASGDLTISSGVNSIATGNKTKASGKNSVAMGDNTQASGWASTAMGSQT